MQTMIISENYLKQHATICLQILINLTVKDIVRDPRSFIIT